MKKTPKELIAALKLAIRKGNKKEMLDLVAPDDVETYPDWDKEPHYVWKQWDDLTDVALELLGL